MACCEASLASGRPRCAVATAAATLRLLSRLRFGSRASSEPYADIGTRCKQALKAAFDAGAPISQQASGCGLLTLRLFALATTRCHAAELAALSFCRLAPIGAFVVCKCAPLPYPSSDSTHLAFD